MSNPAAIEKLTEVQDQVLARLAQVQEPIVNAVRQVAEAAEERLPELPALPYADKLPGAEELIASQHAFATKVIDQQRAFAEALVEAARPVSEKLVVVEDKPAAKTATKAA